MSANSISWRWASATDLPAISGLMSRAIAELQRGFLDERQIAASAAVMGTRHPAYRRWDLRPGGVGRRPGGLRRLELARDFYGGDASQVAREARRLDPATEAARIRAMYTEPRFARRGIGSLSALHVRDGRRGSRFPRRRVDGDPLGRPLYRARGYVDVEQAPARVGEIEVPLIRMRKALSSADR